MDDKSITYIYDIKSSLSDIPGYHILYLGLIQRSGPAVKVYKKIGIRIGSNFLKYRIYGENIGIF